MIETCVFCLERPATEVEHVLPKSWYPSTTPGTVQRLTVPVCRPCNVDFARAEHAFKIPVLMGLDPGHPEVAGVAEAFSRSWQPKKATTAKEARYRERQLQSISRKIKYVMRPPHDL